MVLHHIDKNRKSHSISLQKSRFTSSLEEWKVMGARVLMIPRGQNSDAFEAIPSRLKQLGLGQSKISRTRRHN